MGLPRCACGFVMPAPGHARDCKLYDANVYKPTTNLNLGHELIWSCVAMHSHNSGNDPWPEKQAAETLDYIERRLREWRPSEPPSTQAFDSAVRSMAVAVLKESGRTPAELLALGDSQPESEVAQKLESWLCACGNGGSMHPNRTESHSCGACGIVHLFDVTCSNGWPLGRGDLVQVIGGRQHRVQRIVRGDDGRVQVWTGETGGETWYGPHQLQRAVGPEGGCDCDPDNPDPPAPPTTTDPAATRERRAK